MSRVYVDYSGKKPKITFDVPKRKQQRKNADGFGIFIIVLISLLIELSIYALGPHILLNRASANLTACYDLKIINQTYSGLHLGFECRDDNNIIYNDTFLYSRSKTVEFLGKNISSAQMNFDTPDIYINGKYQSWIMLYCMAAGLIFFIFLLPLRKRIGRFMTRGDGKDVRPKYIIKFKSKDVFKKKGKWMCEIPDFGNIYIDYNTTEDFDKYLQKINVVDLPVYDLKKNRFRKGWKRPFKRLNKKNLIKGKKSIGFWKAEFIFSRKPMKGEMVCKFK